ncbi:cyclodeaminase [Desmospora activa]|uniref:Ornithine cyclodeaminase n=1 Tax=Desmospora activa DSM 45169 TaxID=1121389 RepID=A0A2T4Z240_9BACL|nr:cyclodeaminase [Desmospora activa]PTM54818.1 ornithine cyclodeaminase [Desmospora activa DSM 45169]
MWIFSKKEIQRFVAVDGEAVDTVERGFALLGEGKVETPPILRVDFPEVKGEVDVKTAAVKGLPFFAIKISSGFFLNPEKGLASGSGMMVLIRTDTGQPEALLLDDGYLTDVRTAAAGAVAARYLAREGRVRAGVIGAGGQAYFQMKGLSLVRELESVSVWSPTRERAESCARKLAQELQVDAMVAPDAQAVVRESDIVVTATPAEKPVVQPEWLHSGLHITAMGSDARHKRELGEGVLAAADRVVCDLKSQCLQFGELRAAVEEGAIDPETVTELGELAAKAETGRKHPEEITVCDLTGTGVQDTMIAIHAYLTLREHGCGMVMIRDNYKKR